MGKWKCVVNLPFIKGLNQSEHHTQQHFPKINCAVDYMLANLFSSTAGLGNE